MDHYLQSLLEPRSIAMFGASERIPSIGQSVYSNLLQQSYRGKIYPINPKYTALNGVRCYRNIEEVEHSIEMAIITTPAQTVSQIIEDCGKCGVKAAIILSAGFSEASAQGKLLEEKILRTARRYGLRIVGPNCLGVIRPKLGLNATFCRGPVAQGSLALVSQSGALCTAILDWASTRDIGFSSVVSMGASADIHFGDILDYLTYDQATQSILLYIEGIKDARSFISALKAASRVKPVLVVKVGRHASGALAAKSHTGVLCGADDVFSAALRQAGGVRGYRVNDLFVAATVLSEHHRLKGQNLAIITNGGGPGALAADRVGDLGLCLAPLSEQIVTMLDKILPYNWSRSNPIDILGDATPQRYEQALSLCLGEKDIHCIIVILTPQAMTQPLEVAKKVAEVATKNQKVVLCCWMGGTQVDSGRAYLEKHDIPAFKTPEASVEAFSYLRHFYINQQLLLQVPAPLAKGGQNDTPGAKIIIQNALSEGRDTLTELESIAILNAYHIPTTRITLARNANEAVLQAETTGFPIAMKVYSKDISHKTDIGGVRLGITNAMAAQSAFHDIINTVKQLKPQADVIGVTIENMYTTKYGRELLVGLSTDPVFGPVITFGAGGTAVEVLRDREVAIPPLNKMLAQEMISRTKIAKMLSPFRELPQANLQAVEDVLLRVSEIACDLPWIKELDINPLIVDDQKAISVDARIIISHHSRIGRYDHMSIHPYPSHLIRTEVLHSGELLTIRPIRPEDAAIEKSFVENLSSQSKYYRFLHAMKELPPSLLARFTQIDYDHEMALIAVVEENDNTTEIGVARYVTNVDRDSCEFAVVVADDWHRKGIAFKLMEALIESARENGLHAMEGTVLAENKAMLSFCRHMEFDIEPVADDQSIYKVIKYLR